MADGQLADEEEMEKRWKGKMASLKFRTFDL